MRPVTSAWDDLHTVISELVKAAPSNGNTLSYSSSRIEGMSSGGEQPHFQVEKGVEDTAMSLEQHNNLRNFAKSLQLRASDFLALSISGSLCSKPREFSKRPLSTWACKLQAVATVLYIEKVKLSKKPS
eukprot:4902084-Amphidinium_carterae.1